MNVQDEAGRISFLVSVWHEEDVWNFSATDLPIVAYGNTLEAARNNFEEAVESHFQALAHFGELEQVMHQLRTLTSDKSFYETRIRLGIMVEPFLVPQVEPLTRAA